MGRTIEVLSIAEHIDIAWSCEGRFIVATVRKYDGSSSIVMLGGKPNNIAWCNQEGHVSLRSPEFHPKQE